MTDTELEVEPVAQQIAAGGRDALVERLRGAYAEAALAHADLVSLDRDRVEELIQDAADHADGLQWRHALAEVASVQLGISVSEALSHPSVARAQSLVGAPSYEQSRAELMPNVPLPQPSVDSDLPAPPPAPVPALHPALDLPPEPELTAEPEPELTAEPEPELTAEPEPELTAEPQPELTAEPQPELALEPELAVDVGPEPAAGPEPVSEVAAQESTDALEAVEADDVVVDLLPEPDPVELETQLFEAVDGEYTPAPATPAAAGPVLEPEPFDPGEEPEQPVLPGLDELRVSAIHLGGVANLPTRTDGLDLRLASQGLDILQSDGEIIGRLVWEEIDALEVPHTRSRRRRQQTSARLIVRTPHGDASFEVPGFASEELRDRVEPLAGRYGRR